MNEPTVFSTFGMHIINGCLIVSVSRDMDDESALDLQRDVLEKVKTTGAKKVLINVSALQVLSVQTFIILRNTAQMVTMLGALAVFAGFQPGVASALVDLDAPVEGIRTAITMEGGIALLENEMAISDTSEAAEPVEDANKDPDANAKG